MAIVVFALAASACGSDAEASQGAVRGPQRTTLIEEFIEPPPIAEDATVDHAGDPLAPGLGNGGYDVAQYDLNLAWDPELREIDATATLTAAALSDLEVLHLDFIGSFVRSVAVDGAEAQFERDGAELIVTPAAPIGVGADFEIVVEYVTSVFAASGRSELARGDVGWIETSDGIWYTRSAPDGAHYWFPGNDHPSDPASFVTEITVPLETIAIASGDARTAAHNLETIEWRWSTSDEIPTHAMTVAIAPTGLELVNDLEASNNAGIEIRHLLPADLAAKPPIVLSLVDEMILFLEQRFGRFPYDSWGVAVVTDAAPARPSNSWTIMTRADLESDDAALRLMNDLANHYFGQSVGIGEWSDIWLTAAIPLYMQWLWLQGSVGRSGLDVTLAAARAKVNNAGWPPPDAPLAGDIYVGSTSVHGALFLHALSIKMGDSQFFDLLAQSYGEHRSGTLTTAEFLARGSDIAGERLEPFASAWFHRDPLPGFPDS